MIINEILEFNKKFVEEKGYEPYITSKYPNKKTLILSCMDTRLTELLPAALGLKNGVVKTPIESATFIEDFGLEGDAHSGSGKRQVSLLAQESIDKMKATSGTRGKGLCEGKFAENITTEGLELYTLPIGTKLKIGDTIQAVSQIGKECHTGCEIMKQVGQCIMPKEGIFTMVIKGGVVKAGDTIEIIKE